VNQTTFPAASGVALNDAAIALDPGGVWANVARVAATAKAVRATVRATAAFRGR
jgi:hypothetical protein